MLFKRLNANFFGDTEILTGFFKVSFGFIEDEIGSLGIATLKCLDGPGHALRDLLTALFRDSTGGIEEVLLLAFEFVLELIFAIQ